MVADVGAVSLLVTVAGRHGRAGDAGGRRAQRGSTVLFERPAAFRIAPKPPSLAVSRRNSGALRPGTRGEGLSGRWPQASIIGKIPCAAARERVPSAAKIPTLPPCQKPPAHQRPRNPRPRRSKGDHVFLVDGSGYIFRAYHALPPLNRKSDGLQVNAVLGFCNMLWKLLRDMKPEETADPPGGDVRQVGEDVPQRALSGLQGAPAATPPDDLIPQFPLIREAVRAFDLPCLEQAGFEADDLIATYVRAGLRGRRHRDHRVLRQGPDAARRRRRRHVRHHEGQADRHRRGDREVRRAAGEGDRGAGAGRRLRPTTCRACRASASRPRRS